jgi:hypothetical protein
MLQFQKYINVHTLIFKRIKKKSDLAKYVYTIQRFK